MTNPERAELDILRAEKSKWEALREEDRSEKARLMQELNDLRSQVTHKPINSSQLPPAKSRRKEQNRRKANTDNTI
jgi:hypothetical protein